ncbi:chromosome segregation protein [Pseudovibrio sp. Ad46]|uniref:AAA family ATPase n=1 Tax=Pseudovibrio sp. Ad46 TaxID=989432 RepID=UPI0007AE83C8|nr:AAA family ATPase [Pseudovibrio sp. Ad46]KZK80049.1 chromosome segregation protein [Pseudovibrio sp. Ad46]
MTNTFTLRHLCFSGPRKQPAAVTFTDGLNIIYGPSNTGKSSILDAIDFMLGRESAPKELPEHVGYSDISLGIRFSDNSEITLTRSIRGGDYKLYEGLHLVAAENLNHEILKAKKPTKKNDSISNFLLKKIGLFGKELKKNAKNTKKNLTLRTLLPLFFVNESDIQSEISPFFSGQYTEKTFELSRLRFLLTGVDDSSLVEEKVIEEARISRSAKASVLDEIVDGMRKKILEVASEETSIDELASQLSKLEVSIEDANSSLTIHQSNYHEVLSRKNDEQRIFREKSERLVEVGTMISRFNLLLKHYVSDISRLDGIIESGNLIAALPDELCPLCGASPDNHSSDHLCEGDINEVTIAAKAEKAKVALLQGELVSTLSQLSLEEHQLIDSVTKQRERLDTWTLQLQDLQPDLTTSRADYSLLIAKKSEVSRAIELFDSLKKLEVKLNENSEVQALEQETTENKIPETSLFDLARDVGEFLDDWKLPNSQNVHFSSDTNDIVINGKHRRSNGKGHRSITHSAVTLGLSLCLQNKKLPHTGFVVLDSPLIAYEEPDEVDEISHTDLNKNFFDSLEDWSRMQTIVLENKKSVPSNIHEYGNVIQFTKNKELGRYGFFPI